MHDANLVTKIQSNPLYEGMTNKIHVYMKTFFLSDVYRCSVDGSVTRPVECRPVDDNCSEYTSCETDSKFTGCTRKEVCKNDMGKTTRENVCEKDEIFARGYDTCLPKHHIIKSFYGKKLR